MKEKYTMISPFKEDRFVSNNRFFVEFDRQKYKALTVCVSKFEEDLQNEEITITIYDFADKVLAEFYNESGIKIGNITLKVCSPTGTIMKEILFRDCFLLSIYEEPFDYSSDSIHQISLKFGYIDCRMEVFDEPSTENAEKNKYLFEGLQNFKY